MLCDSFTKEYKLAMNVFRDELKTLGYQYVDVVSSLKQIREARLTRLKHVLQMTETGRGLKRPFGSLYCHLLTLASSLFQNLYQAVSGLPVNAAIRRARPGNHFHYVVLVSCHQFPTQSLHSLFLFSAINGFFGGRP